MVMPTRWASTPNSQQRGLEGLAALLDQLPVDGLGRLAGEARLRRQLPPLLGRDEAELELRGDAGRLAHERRRLEDEVLAGRERGRTGRRRAGPPGRSDRPSASGGSSLGQVDGQGGGEVGPGSSAAGGLAAVGSPGADASSSWSIPARKRRLGAARGGVVGVEVGGHHIARRRARSPSASSAGAARRPGAPHGHRRPAQAPPDLVEREPEQDQAADEGQDGQDQPGAPRPGQRAQRVADHGAEGAAGPAPAVEALAPAADAGRSR